MAAMLEGITLPSNMANKTTTCLHLVKRLIAMLKIGVNTTTTSFLQFSWSSSAKFAFID